MGWIQDSWHGVTHVGSSTWIAWAAWAAIALAVVTLVFTNRQSAAIAARRRSKPARTSGCSWNRIPPTGT